MYLTINGCELYVEVSGPQSGTAIVTLHGGGGMGDSRSKRIGYGPLDDEYRVISFDQRGCGRSADAGITDFDTWTADIEALCDHLDCGRVVIAGGSSGGYVALEFALRYPDRVAALILRGTGAHRAETDVLREKALSSGLPLDWERFDRYWNGECLDNEDMAQAFWEVMPLYSGDGKWDPVSARKKWEDIYWHYQTNNYVINHVFPGWDLRSRIGEIEVPTLIIHGEHDWVIPVEHAHELNNGIPSSQLEVFAGCGHGPHLEETEKFVRTVREFLAEHVIA